MKEFLSKNNINFIYFNISESLFNLKLFLKYRDNSPAFKEVKEKGRVGVPCIMINKGENFFFSQDSLNMDKLREY